MAQVGKKYTKWILFAILIVVAAFIIFPILIVLMNSFKGNLFISSAGAFKFPNEQSFVGISNYTNGIDKINFFTAFGYSLWITIASVVCILLLTSMLAWYITRVKGKVTTIIYYLLVFSMIVPFQMVMYTMSKLFIKSIPLALEEAAMIDGASPVRTFFSVVLPMLKSTAITIAILETMWVWNDYLMPYLVIGTEYRTIPVAIQYLRGGYGSVDMGAMMAMLVLAMIPVIVFFLTCQKYIIKGVLAGAVKG